MPCEGSGKAALEMHPEALNRHTREYDDALKKAQGVPQR